MYPFKSICLYPLSKYLVVQLLGHRVVLFFTFWGNSILFSRVAGPVCIPTDSVGGFLFSASMPTPIVSYVVNSSHSDMREVVSYCVFDLYFSDDERASFHVPVGHLDVFFGKVSIHVLCPFLNWIIYFLGVEFDKFFVVWILTLYMLFICHLQISSPIL